LGDPTRRQNARRAETPEIAEADPESDERLHLEVSSILTDAAWVYFTFASAFRRSAQ
jgi:hypothetical protein